MRTELVLESLRMGLRRRSPEEGLLHHSDRGSQYASHDYQRALKRADITCSMSRKGECYDNAVVASFFGTFKTELIEREPWPTMAQAEEAIAEYIEVFYNCRRRHSALGYQSPAEYERRYHAATAQAA